MVTLCIYTGDNNEDTEFLYYMNEGVYGPFSCKLLGNSIGAPSVHKVSRSPPKRVNPIQEWMKDLIAAPVKHGKGVMHYEYLRWQNPNWCRQWMILSPFKTLQRLILSWGIQTQQCSLEVTRKSKRLRVILKKLLATYLWLMIHLLIFALLPHNQKITRTDTN